MNPSERWGVVMNARGLSGVEKAALCCLAYHADSESLEAWPALETIAAESGFRRTAVWNALRSLVARGVLTPVSQSAGRHSNRYRGNLDQPATWRMVEPAASRTVHGANGSLDERFNLPPSERQPAVTRTSTCRQVNPNKERTGKDQLFDQFWSIYPKKVAKGAAEKAWRKIRPDGQLAGAIFAAVEKAKSNPSWRKDGGQFIPHPATWLNQRRWEDEPMTAVEPKHRRSSASTIVPPI
jgi:hypothetical protein